MRTKDFSNELKNLQLQIQETLHVGHPWLTPVTLAIWQAEIRKPAWTKKLVRPQPIAGLSGVQLSSQAVREAEIEVPSQPV
jgi:hypothetical protein